jgi:hypothetical protein
MHGLLHVLAESLASDTLWAVLVFLTALITMAGLRTMGSHITAWRRRKRRRVVR